ncbi:hypothetical protein [Rhodopirellula sp. MGV]|uniref:hypothetical protein n=1 Tax=Rhodopirellula sp. MGV TaxID=2023130 RepID=UPI000B95F812|nr:hypothetical protein [Rhodopirellula sp. MGV]PNY34427.1 hypothetical protein C2E31_23550 [Rhodopirellula baltica]
MAPANMPVEEPAADVKPAVEVEAAAVASVEPAKKSPAASDEGWTRRGAPQSTSQKNDTSVARDVTASVAEAHVAKAPAEQSPTRKPLPALPVSDPSDKGQSRAELPSMKLGEAESKAKAENTVRENAIQTPGARLLAERRAAQQRSASQWQGRGDAEAALSVGDMQASEAPAAVNDQSIRAISEGNWVARDAINRIAPLRDPVAASVEPAVKPQPIHEVAPKAQPAPPTQPAPQQRAPSQPEANERVVEPKAQPRVEISEPGERKKLVPKASVVPNADLAPRYDDLPSEENLGDDDALSLESPMAREDAPNVLRDETVNEEVKLQPKRSERVAVSRRSEPAKLTELPADTAELTPLPKGNLSQRLEAPGSASASVGDLPSQDDVVIDSPASEAAPDQIGQPETEEADVELDYTGRPSVEIQPNRTVASLRRPMERVLSYFYQNPEVAAGRSNWGMMHQLMVFGSDTQVRVGNRLYSTIAWIAGNNICRGQRLLTNDADGIKAKSGVGLQGHESQFLAVLGMCNVPVEYPLYAGQMKYNVDALIKSEQRGCKPENELTFTLIGFSHYLDTDSTWIAADGSEWDFERLIAEELEEPIVGAACGGTHRLMGYAHALRKRRAEGKPIEGHWKRAEIYTNDFIDYAYSLQNRDGSMSTEWFEGRGDNNDVDRKIQTTGHIVEWLLTVTPDEDLQDRRLVAAVSYLLRAMASDLDHDWAIGPKGHALRSLAMYHQRVFRAGTPWVPQQTASAASLQNRR